jgi:hypothetical protein
MYAFYQSCLRTKTLMQARPAWLDRPSQPSQQPADKAPAAFPLRTINSATRALAVKLNPLQAPSANSGSSSIGGSLTHVWQTTSSLTRSMTNCSSTEGPHGAAVAAQLQARLGSAAASEVYAPVLPPGQAAEIQRPSETDPMLPLPPAPSLVLTIHRPNRVIAGEAGPIRDPQDNTYERHLQNVL